MHFFHENALLYKMSDLKVKRSDLLKYIRVYVQIDYTNWEKSLKVISTKNWKEVFISKWKVM